MIYSVLATALRFRVRVTSLSLLPPPIDITHHSKTTSIPTLLQFCFEAVWSVAFLRTSSIATNQIKLNYVYVELVMVQAGASDGLVKAARSTQVYFL